MDSRDPRQQPQAPEPQWEKPPKPPFDRERFLLWCVAWILGVQFGLFILAGIACVYGYTVKLGMITNAQEPTNACPRITDEIKTAAGDSLAVLLALLGGGTLAIGEYQRRHPPSRPGPEDVPPHWRPPAPGPDPRSLDPRDPRSPGN